VKPYEKGEVKHTVRVLLRAFEEAAQRMRLSEKDAQRVRVQRLPAQLCHPRVGRACFTPHDHNSHHTDHNSGKPADCAKYEEFGKRECKLPVSGAPTNQEIDHAISQSGERSASPSTNERVDQQSGKKVAKVKVK
jgi:hypothetical protein